MTHMLHSMICIAAFYYQYDSVISMGQEDSKFKFQTHIAAFYDMYIV